MSNPVSCICAECMCNVGTRHASRLCLGCRDGQHPGTMLKAKPKGLVNVPPHSRMFGAPCPVCGAPPGWKCRKRALAQELERLQRTQAEHV